MSSGKLSLLDLLAKKPIECPPNVMDCGFNLEDDLDQILDLSKNTRHTSKIIISAVFIAIATLCFLFNIIGFFNMLKVWKQCQTNLHLLLLNLLIACGFTAVHCIGMGYPTYSSSFFNVQINFMTFKSTAFYGIFQFLGNFGNQLILWNLLAIIAERLLSTSENNLFESRRFSFLILSVIWIESLICSSFLSVFKCGYYGGSFRDTARSFRCFAIVDTRKWYWIEMIMVAQVMLVILVWIFSLLYLLVKYLTSATTKAAPTGPKNNSTKQAIVVFLMFESTLLLSVVRNYTNINPIHTIRGKVDLSSFEAYDIFKTLEELTPVLYASVHLLLLAPVPIYLYFANRKLRTDKGLVRRNAKRTARVGSATSLSMIYVHVARPARKSMVWDKSVMVY